jgi:hypothetical protein
MNPQKSKLTILIVLLSLGMGVLCVVLMAWNARLRSELAALKQETGSLRVRLEAEHHPKPPANPVTKGRAAQASRDLPSDTSTTLQPAGASTPPTSETKRQVNAEELSAMLQSPILQKIMASQTAAIMQMTYERLMDHFELSPEERDYFQRLVVEKQSNLQNLGMQFMNPGLSAEDRQALAQRLQEAWTNGEAKIRTFLNDDADFAYYQTYNEQEPERKEVGMFESSLGGGDALDAATSDALAKLQSDARKNFGFTVDFYDQKNFGNTSVLTTAAVQKFLDEQSAFQFQVAEKAAGILTPAQLQVYKQNQATVRQMTSMQLTSIVQMAGGR